jgi:hypothetical protein
MADKRKIQGGYYKPSSSEYEQFLKLLNPEKRGLKPFGVHNVHLPAEKEIGLDQYLGARRANPQNKYGAKDRMETQEYGYDKETMGNLLKAYKDAITKHGIKSLHPDDLANMALVEGRSNFGYNAYNHDNKEVQKIVKDLIKAGHDPYAAGFPAAIADKQRLAEKLGIPFYQAWNGVSPAGKTYADKIEQHRYAVKDPRNQALREYIKQTMGYKEPDVKMAQDAPVELPSDYRAGGRVRMI